MSDRLVLYHGPGCADGFCSAYVAWSVYGDAAEYVEVQYGQLPPDVTDRDVLIVDFSYPRAVLLEMAAKAQSLRVLDHHVSAQRDLEGLEFCTFDMNESGASLTWKELYSDRPMPLLVQLVRDRDLWRWELPDSRALNAWIGTIDRLFSSWSAVERLLDWKRDELAERGYAILKHIDEYVRSTAVNATHRIVAGHDVPVVNAPGMMASELVGALAEKGPFAVGWFQMSDGRYKYSLRSRGAAGEDVSKIAERFGGAGHRNASGFVADMPPDVLFAKETP